MVCMFQESAVDIDNNSQMLVLSEVEEEEEEPAVAELQPSTEDLQPGEYTIMDQTDEIITLMDKNTGHILRMPADAVVMDNQ